MLKRDMQDSADAVARDYSHQGHPTVEELMSAQGLAFPRDPSELLGNFWPEEEPIEEFLSALHEWRRRERTDPAA